MLQTQNARITALDTLRGCAVLGILLMNIHGFGAPPPAYLRPDAAAIAAGGADLYLWYAEMLLFEGTMRGLFTLLFGAGVLLFIARRTRQFGAQQVASLHYRRAAALIGFGLLNAYVLVWSGDILFLYGIAACVLYPLRDCTQRQLLKLAIPLLCLQPLIGTVGFLGYLQARADSAPLLAMEAAGATLSAAQRAELADYRALLADVEPTESMTRETVAAMRASYLSAVRYNAPIAWSNQTVFLPTQALWEALGMMLLGMLLLRSGALDGRWSTRRYLLLLLSGYGIGLAVNLAEISWVRDGGFATERILAIWYVTYDFGRIPMTLGHLALIMLAIRATRAGALQRALNAVGRMALSNYLAQSVLCLLLFTGAGFAWFGQLERHELYYVVFAIWILQLGLSSGWLRHHAQGPAEWLWRAATERKKGVGL